MSDMITVDHVSMSFRINKKRTTSLKEWFILKMQRQMQYELFEAVKDVSFTVRRGEVVGIIGRNGAGKSTILKIISGIYRPTTGTVVTRGRIAPMLELGSGFDHELSARENVFLNGAVLGFDEQFLKDRYDTIVSFAELEKFMDQPLKTFSSGMTMRLAFSVATQVDPEILIVDEILSVGDAAFRKKSEKRMMEMIGGGTTVLLVSHSMNQIRKLCERVIWLDHGTIRQIGPTQEVCDAYEAEVG